MNIKQFFRMSVLSATLLSSFTGSFVLASEATTNTRPTASFASQTDEQLAMKVSEAIKRYPYYDIYDWIQIQVNNGAVTVNGAVHQPFHKADIMKKVEKVTGVRSVVDQITVLPLSPSDNRLRFTIARKIYRQPMLQRYGLGPNPPIHIIVNNGVVTLQGIVNTQAEKHVAELLARQSSAFKVIDDLQVES